MGQEHQEEHWECLKMHNRLPEIVNRIILIHYNKIMMIMISIIRLKSRRI